MAFRVTVLVKPYGRTTLPENGKRDLLNAAAVNADVQ